MDGFISSSVTSGEPAHTMLLEKHTANAAASTAQIAFDVLIG